jgi:hypothetical protein
MGKDREGKFHPRKGKPSGSLKEDSTIDLESIEAPLRHPNRNVHKGEDFFEGKKTPATITSKRTPSAQRPKTGIDSLDTLTADLLKDLGQRSGEISVSIYLPTFRQGADVNEKKNEIEWKTALKQAFDQLLIQGISKNVAEELLNPAQQTLEILDFQQRLPKGIGIFLSHNYYHIVALPFSPMKEVVVANAFELAPILPMWHSHYFFLLVLSKKQAKLFQCTPFNLTPIALPEMPNGIEDVVHLEEKNDQKLFRTGSSGGGSGGNYHGMGSGQPDDKENIALYFEEIDRTIRQEVLHNENVPVLLAGVDYMIPIYKKVSHYRYIYPEALIGNYEHKNMSVLFEEVKEKMQSWFEEPSAKAMETFRNSLGSHLALTFIPDIMRAAEYGQVRTLWIKPNTHLWGIFNKNVTTPEIHHIQQPQDECLINRAAVMTWLNGGDVFPLQNTEGDQEMLALLRYETF